MSDLFTFPFQEGSRGDQLQVVMDSDGSRASVALSIVSILIALAALAVTVWRERRDRFRIDVQLRGSVRDDRPAARIELSNTGRRPVMVGPVSVMWSLEKAYGDLPPEVEIALEDPIVRHEMPPGSSKVLFWPVPMTLKIHESTPMRAVAYVGGRPAYSEPRAVVGRLLHVFPSLASRMAVGTEELAPPLRGKRLVARWKVWQPRHLRQQIVDVERRSAAGTSGTSPLLEQLPDDTPVRLGNEAGQPWISRAPLKFPAEPE